MLALGDPRWGQLSHAYGQAHDIPELLRTLAADTNPAKTAGSEPWFSIWSSLCHQGDVYDASYAAVPHIVHLAVEAEDPIDFSFFQFPAAVEIAREQKRGPNIPLDLVDAYYGAIAALGEAIAKHRREMWDKDTLLSVLSALAVTKGHHRISEAIMNLDDNLIQRLIDLDFDS